MKATNPQERRDHLLDLARRSVNDEPVTVPPVLAGRPCWEDLCDAVARQALAEDPYHVLTLPPEERDEDYLAKCAERDIEAALADIDDADVALADLIAQEAAR